jgi:hypothetical protein
MEEMTGEGSIVFILRRTDTTPETEFFPVGEWIVIGAIAYVGGRIRIGANDTTDRIVVVFDA